MLTDRSGGLSGDDLQVVLDHPLHQPGEVDLTTPPEYKVTELGGLLLAEMDARNGVGDLRVTNSGPRRSRSWLNRVPQETNMP